MKDYPIIYKTCSYYNGNLVIENVPYLVFSTPAPTGETEAKDGEASLVVSVVGEKFKNGEYGDTAQFDYADLAKDETIRARLDELYQAFDSE